MRFLSILPVIFCLFVSSVLAQPKIQFGVNTEGSWFMPSEPSFYSQPNKDGLGVGVGVYTSRNIFWRISSDLGVMYRYSGMQQYYQVYGNSGGNYGGGNGYPTTPVAEGWDKLPMHSIVIPFHLKMHISKNLFIRGGIESAWLLNYEMVNEKPEFNWTLGFGSDIHKLSWSFNYIKGFKDQGFGNGTLEADGHYHGSIYRNNMLQLNLSYPLWQKK